jgi:hypothetical protein
MSNGDSNQGTGQGGGEAAQRGVSGFVKKVVEAIGNAVQGAHAPPGTPSVGTAGGSTPPPQDNTYVVPDPNLQSQPRSTVTGAPADTHKTGP